MKYIPFTMLLGLLLASCMGRGGTGKTLAELAAARSSVTEPISYTYKIKSVLPHDPKSYTQGLYWEDGYFYEGTGLYGESALIKVDPATGKAVQRTGLSAEYFGEGIARLRNTVYQLTWTNKTCFTYDPDTFRKTGSFSYQGEGWGITTDGELLYMSDGTSWIKVLDPKTFATKRDFAVTNAGRPVEYLNELEWIEGELWANVYMTDQIVRIDPATGVVTGVVDLEGLLPEADRTVNTDVLNGIAYDPVGKKIYVTGKKWSKLFEIEVVKK